MMPLQLLCATTLLIGASGAETAGVDAIAVDNVVVLDETVGEIVVVGQRKLVLVGE